MKVGCVRVRTVCSQPGIALHIILSLLALIYAGSTTSYGAVISKHAFNSLNPACYAHMHTLPACLPVWTCPQTLHISHAAWWSHISTSLLHTDRLLQPPSCLLVPLALCLLLHACMPLAPIISQPCSHGRHHATIMPAMQWNATATNYLSSTSTALAWRRPHCTNTKQHGSLASAEYS